MSNNPHKCYNLLWASNLFLAHLVALQLYLHHINFFSNSLAPIILLSPSNLLSPIPLLCYNYLCHIHYRKCLHSCAINIHWHNVIWLNTITTNPNCATLIHQTNCASSKIMGIILTQNHVSSPLDLNPLAQHTLVETTFGATILNQEYPGVASFLWCNFIPLAQHQHLVINLLEQHLSQCEHHTLLAPTLFVPSTNPSFFFNVFLHNPHFSPIDATTFPNLPRNFFGFADLRPSQQVPHPHSQSALIDKPF